MAGTTSAFNCPGCGKRFIWKIELAGKSARCKCGGVVRIPTDDPANDAEAGLYDLVDGSPTSGAGSIGPRPVMVEQQVVAAPVAPPRPACTIVSSTDAPPTDLGLDESIARKLAERGVVPGKKKVLVDEDPYAKAEPRWRSVYLPVALIALGIILCIHAARLTKTGDYKPLPDAINAAAIQMALSLGLVIGGVFLAAVILGIEMPDVPGITILKLAAVSLAPSAISIMILMSMGEINGALVGQLAGVALYALLFFLLFRLQATDIAMCVVVIVILSGFAQWVAFKVEGARSGSWI